MEWLILDSTSVRAHPHSAGANKKGDGTGGQEEQALGRSRGGFGTKIHAAVSGLMLPVRLRLTAGQVVDVMPADAFKGAVQLVHQAIGDDFAELARRIPDLTPESVSAEPVGTRS